MAEIKVKIEVQKIWLEEPTDLSECDACNDVIYSRMLRLWIMPKADNINLRGHKTSMVLCDSCFQLLNE
jgi:hypothetical protein